MIFEVLHDDSICRSRAVPSERGGRPASPLFRSVSCGDCGLVGTLASPGFEDQARQEWADRGGFEVLPFYDQYTVHPRRRP